MGIEFFPCAICGETFPDCGDYYSCDDCGNVFCSHECAKLIFDEDDGYSRCCICLKSQVSDYVLLQYLLKINNLTREQAFEKWRQDPEE